jgi:hypothetical protein
MTVRRRIAAVAVVLGTLLPVAAAPAHAADVTIYMIKNRGSGLCVQPPHENRYDVGVQLVQDECDNHDPAQWWTRNWLGGTTYQFWNLNTLGCLDAHGPNTDRTPVDTWPCSSISNQKWTMSEQWRLVSAIGGRCLDVAAGSLQPDALIQIYHCTDNNTAQQFLVEPLR